MRIETIGPLQPIINIDGKPYVLNIKEYESLLTHCQTFMATDIDSVYDMIQTLSDQLIDCADHKTTVEELRVQLKFLRELGFFFKSLLTPL